MTSFKGSLDADFELPSASTATWWIWHRTCTRWTYISSVMLIFRLALALEIWPWPKIKATAQVSWGYKIHHRDKLLSVTG